jgi:hypothetical protein
MQRISIIRVLPPPSQQSITMPSHGLLTCFFVAKSNIHEDEAQLVTKQESPSGLVSYGFWPISILQIQSYNKSNNNTLPGED